MLTQQQINLAENLAELKDNQNFTDPTGSIEQQINEAREKVFSEWVQNIANYTPFSNGE